jgi:hypothetical protein
LKFIKIKVCSFVLIAFGLILLASALYYRSIIDDNEIYKSISEIIFSTILIYFIGQIFFFITDYHKKKTIKESINACIAGSMLRFANTKIKSYKLDNVAIDIIADEIINNIKSFNYDSYQEFYYSVINDYDVLCNMINSTSVIDHEHSFAFFNLVSNLKALKDQYVKLETDLNKRKQDIMKIKSSFVFHSFIDSYLILYVKTCKQFYCLKIAEYE